MILKDFKFNKNNFDLIRLFAALQVCIVHGYEHFGLSHGSLVIELIKLIPGVPIFFVVSGFLISASYERGGSLKLYFQNRMLRIFPALWVCLIFSTCILYSFDGFDVGVVELGVWLLAQTTFFQFYNPDFIREFGVGVINGSLWTIPVELQFYFILPLLYLFFKKLKWNYALVVLSIILLMLFNSYFVSIKGTGLYAKLLGVSVLPYLYMFLLGVILQRNLNFVERFLSGNFLVWLLVYSIVVFNVYYFGGIYQGNYINPFLSVALSFLVISAAYSGLRYKDVLRGNDISYGVYIYHMVIVNAFIELSNISPALKLALMLLITVVIALLSWKFVERPILKLKRNTIKVHD